MVPCFPSSKWRKPSSSSPPQLILLLLVSVWVIFFMSTPSLQIDEEPIYDCHGFLSNDTMVCSGHGTCIAPDHCSCRPGYASEQCEWVSCFHNYPKMVQCSNHGECIALDTCKCYDLYTGPNCEQCKEPFHAGENCPPIQCFGIEYSVKSVCSGNGDCIAPNNCSCHEGFIGDQCEQFTCLNSTTILNNTLDTNSSNNNSFKSCSGHGECIGANTCNCYADVVNGYWSGTNCDKCKSGYGGVECKEPVCDPATTCLGRGECNQQPPLPNNNVKYFFSGYQLISKSPIRAQNFRNLTIEGSIASEGGFSVQVLKSAYGQVNIRNDISKNIVDSAVALYQELSKLDCDQTLQQSVPSGGLNLKAGTYCFPQGLNGGGKITISGSGRVVLILKTNLNYAFTVEYLDGASVENLFWVVAMGSSIIGKFSGNLVTVGQINVNNAFIYGSIINAGTSEVNLNGASFGPINIPPLDPCKCFGNYAPPYCESCKIGFFGDNCTLSCIPERNCNGRGQCSQTGSCLCDKRFTGAYCEVCASGWTGINCDYSIGDKASLKISKLTMQYANPTLYSTIDCSKVFIEETVNHLGLSPQCYWEDKSTNSFVVDLGYGNNIYDKSILKFKLENGNAASMIVIKEANDIPPTAVLKVSSKISTCGRLELDATSSFSPDKKTLTYQFEVISGPTVTAIDNLKNALSFFGSQTVLSISAAHMVVGRYVMKLTVTSPMSGSSSTTSSFEVLQVPPPTITIPGDLTQTFAYGSVVVINPQISVASCSGSNDGTIVYSTANYQDFSFSWEQNSAGARVPFSQESNNRILVIPSLQNEAYFLFKVSTSDGYYNQAIVALKLRESELVLKVRNGNFLYGKINQEMVIDFSESFDPSKTLETEEFKIECIPLGDYAVCPSAEIYSNVTLDKKFTLAENTLMAGLYQFTITYSKGRRSKSETIVVEMADYIFLNVFIKMATNDFLPSSVPLGMDVSLEAVAPLELRNEVTYSWSSKTSGFFLSDLTTVSGTTGPTLTIRADALSPDTFYTIRLDTRWKHLTGSSEYYLSINTPPKPGQFNINPLQSKSGQELITLSCSGWSDENNPLSYQFYFSDAKSATWQALTGKVSTNQVNIMLPPGYGPSNQLTIKARVYDSTGAYSEMQQVVISN